MNPYEIARLDNSRYVDILYLGDSDRYDRVGDSGLQAATYQTGKQRGASYRVVPE